jgi:hypothetical protein
MTISRRRLVGLTAATIAAGGLAKPSILRAQGRASS